MVKARFWLILLGETPHRFFRPRDTLINSSGANLDKFDFTKGLYILFQS
jgi:hypothetical protein